MCINTFNERFTTPPSSFMFIVYYLPFQIYSTSLFIWRDKHVLMYPAIPFSKIKKCIIYMLLHIWATSKLITLSFGYFIWLQQDATVIECVLDRRDNTIDIQMSWNQEVDGALNNVPLSEQVRHINTMVFLAISHITTGSSKLPVAQSNC